MNLTESQSYNARTNLPQYQDESSDYNIKISKQNSKKQWTEYFFPSIWAYRPEELKFTKPANEPTDDMNNYCYLINHDMELDPLKFYFSTKGICAPHNSEPDDMHNMVNFFETIRKAALAGSAPASKLLSKVLLTDSDFKTSKNLKDPDAPFTMSDIFTISNQRVHTTKLNKHKNSDHNDVVSPLILSFHKASEMGSRIGAQLLQMFFKTLAEDDSIQSTLSSSDSIFKDFFEHEELSKKQKPTTKVSDKQDTKASHLISKELTDMKKFIDFLQNAIAQGNAKAREFSKNIVDLTKSNSDDKKIKPSSGNVFTDFFVPLPEAPNDAHDVKKNSPTSAFFGYLLRATEKGSVPAADLLSQWIASGSSIGNLFGSVLLDQDLGIQKKRHDQNIETISQKWGDRAAKILSKAFLFNNKDHGDEAKIDLKSNNHRIINIVEKNESKSEKNIMDSPKGKSLHNKKQENNYNYNNIIAEQSEKNSINLSIQTDWLVNSLKTLKEKILVE